MILKKIDANYVLSITKINGIRENTTVSFFSKKTAKEIMEYLNSKLCATYESPCTIELQLWDKINTKISYKKIFMYHDLDLYIIKSRLLKKLTKLNETVDIKSTRYQIKIQNKLSQQLDCKTFTFNSRDNLSELLKNVKIHLKQQAEKSNAIISFANQKNLKTTHYITLVSAGTLDRRKNPSKSFSVNIPNYSSRELIDLLRGKNNEE